jgi:hypothetical protein
MSDWQKRQKGRSGRLPAVKTQETYPVRQLGSRAPTEEDAPEGFTLGDATPAEMTEAGFPRDGFPDLVDRETGRVIPGSEVRFIVLRDEQERIVATWDEGRWFDAYESARYVREWARKLQTSDTP